MDTMNSDSRFKAASVNTGLSMVESGSYFYFDYNSFRFDPATGVSLTTPQSYAIAHQQWAWKKINLTTAQRISTGQGVVVAILDTGVDFTHPDLRNKTLPGFDALGVYPDGRDVQGHGTFVAGVVSQVAPGATILPVRVLDANGFGTTEAVMSGLQYAIDHGASVVNLSLSSSVNSKTLHQLIQTARAKGVSVISAAGNDNSQGHYYPAAYSENLAVAATDQQDNRAQLFQLARLHKVKQPRGKYL